MTRRKSTVSLLPYISVCSEFPSPFGSARCDMFSHHICRVRCISIKPAVYPRQARHLNTDSTQTETLGATPWEAGRQKVATTPQLRYVFGWFRRASPVFNDQVPPLRLTLRGSGRVGRGAHRCAWGGEFVGVHGGGLSRLGTLSGSVFYRCVGARSAAATSAGVVGELCIQKAASGRRRAAGLGRYWGTGRY